MSLPNSKQKLALITLFLSVLTSLGLYAYGDWSISSIQGTFADKWALSFTAVFLLPIVIGWYWTIRLTYEGFFNKATEE
jgi:hypothetical protein